MIAYGRRSGKKDFDRDAQNVAASDAVLLVGIANAKVPALNCGACGFADCKGLRGYGRHEGEFAGPQCAFRLLDMGIAIGSAVKTASSLNVDNRIMYRVGVAARQNTAPRSPQTAAGSTASKESMVLAPRPAQQPQFRDMPADGHWPWPPRESGTRLDDRKGPVFR